MNKLSIFALLVLSLKLLQPGSAAAKGPEGVAALRINPIGNPQFVEVSDEATLKGLSSEAGSFFMDPTPIPAQRIERGYEVFIYGRQADGKVYAYDYMRYFPNPSGARGYVIYEGDWHYATARWDALMQQALANQASSAADRSAPQSAAPPAPAATPRTNGGLSVLFLLAAAAAACALWTAYHRKRVHKSKTNEVV